MKQKSYLLGGSSNLRLLGTSDFLHSVLPFLSLFARYLLLLEHALLLNKTVVNKSSHKYNVKTNQGKAMFRFKLLEEVHGIVHKGKASCLATTKVSPESKAGNNIRSHFVHFCQLLGDFLLGDGGSAGMQDINDLRDETVV